MKVIRISGFGLIEVSTFYGIQIWVIGNRPGYKDHCCAMCKRNVPKNTERMYRPLESTMNRMQRICEKCGKGDK